MCIVCVCVFQLITYHVLLYYLGWNKHQVAEIICSDISVRKHICRVIQGTHIHTHIHKTMNERERERERERETGIVDEWTMIRCICVCVCD